MTARKNPARLDEIARKAADTFGGTEAANEWLTSYNTMLGGTPLSLMETDTGAAQVEHVLQALDFGGTA